MRNVKPKVYKSQGYWICRTTGHSGQAFASWRGAMNFALSGEPEVTC